MAIVFDGKEYSESKKILLKQSVTRLNEKGIIPHLATILVGCNPASVKYVSLKKKFIEDCGGIVSVYNLPESIGFEEIEFLINSLNDDKDVNGIMIQLPLTQKLQKSKTQILKLIDLKKDVDGLRENSKFLHPTSKAVIEILKIAEAKIREEAKTIDIVGSTGMVGKPLVKELKKIGYKVNEYDKDTLPAQVGFGVALKGRVLISATGVANLISKKNITNNTKIAIDVGYPFGDFDPRITDFVDFITPVPNGVGPVTITCLLENLVASC
jgi:methylenetetrahydrofolate dehydrogenase (NADP+)/methenyltetrahydrofolate cyclohydrolase